MTEFVIAQGEGYGGQPYEVGSLVWEDLHILQDSAPDAEFPTVTVRSGTREVERGAVIVLTASEEYVREDGLSFGVGDESGYIYRATVRPATAEEASPSITRHEHRMAKVAAMEQAKRLADTIILAAREAGSLTNDERMPLALDGDSIHLNKWHRVIVSGDTVESRSSYTMDATNHSAIVTDAAIAAEVRELLAILNGQGRA